MYELKRRVPHELTHERVSNVSDRFLITWRERTTDVKRARHRHTRDGLFRALTCSSNIGARHVANEWACFQLNTNGLSIVVHRYDDAGVPLSDVIADFDTKT